MPRSVPQPLRCFHNPSSWFWRRIITGSWCYLNLVPFYLDCFVLYFDIGCIWPREKLHYFLVRVVLAGKMNGKKNPEKFKQSLQFVEVFDLSPLLFSHLRRFPLSFCGTAVLIVSCRLFDSLQLNSAHPLFWSLLYPQQRDQWQETWPVCPLEHYPKSGAKLGQKWEFRKSKKFQ